MAQYPIEITLIKQWAAYIAIPIWIMDAKGNLLYYNESAEGLLGKRFEEAGEIHADELATLFTVSDLDGSPIPNDELPVVRALTRSKPAHRHMRITNLDGEHRAIEVTAFPIEGHAGRHLGAMAAFWELDEE